MKHRIDLLTRRRRYWWPKIDRLLSNTGAYATYAIYARERVGIIQKPVQDVEELLRSLGFRREPVAALKIRAGRPHRESAGSWVMKGEDIANLFSDELLSDAHDVGEMQLHITLFALPEGTEINAHYEYRWEPWAPNWDITRPLKHKKPKQYGGYYAPRDGVAMMHTLLQEQEIPYLRFNYDRNIS